MGRLRRSATPTRSGSIPKLRAETNRENDSETLLYRLIKAFLEALGFVVKAEIGGSDLLALRGDDPHIVVISEFKLTFNLELILQGVDRAAACDEVWLAAFRRARRGVQATRGFGTFAEGSVSACSECGRMARWTCW
jgi:hypothetical protein